MGIPIIIFILSLSATFYTWRQSQRHLDLQARNEFEVVVDTTVAKLQERMNIYLNALHGAVALFAASKSVERDEWKAYLDTQKILERLPGVVAIRYIERVPRQKKEEFAKRVKADTSILPAGYPDFKIYPEEDKEESFVVKYVEPWLSNERMLGFSLGWEPARLAALEKARDTGVAVATSRINILTTPGAEVGFLIFLPVYQNKMPVATVEERRAALVGFVDGVFETKKLFQSLMEGEKVNSKVDIDIFDENSITPEHLLYDYDPTFLDHKKPQFISIKTLPIAGQNWSLYFAAMPRFGLNKVESRLPPLVLTVGVLLSLLLAALAYSLASGQTKAIRLAEKMTADSRREKEKLRKILENANDAINIVDKEGKIVAWNAKAQQMFGYTPEEMIGHHFTLCLPERIQQEHLDDFHQLVTGGHSKVLGRPTEIIGRRKDGSEFPFELSLSMIKENSEIVVVAIIRDITERKQAEEALHKSEEELRQNQKMETIGRLAGGVAHDFNNMLTAIIGYTDLLMENLDPATEQFKNVQEIKKAADRSAALTRQLLAFGRRQTFQPKVLNLNEVIQETDKMLRRLLREDVEIKTIFAPNLGKIKADPFQIEQIILNLSINAREAMIKGGKLTIETGNAELDEEYARRNLEVNPGPYVMLAVSDTGVGMDSETRSHLFEPFFTTKQKEGRKGLGLSTVYGIVKQNGGHISVYSELGKGSTFKVYLPLMTEEVSPPVQGGMRGKEKTSERDTVLLVEDEEVVRDLTREVLERAGYRVLVASNGVEALDKSREHTGRIDLLVTDVVMPKMNGRELGEKLGELRPEIRVLYMSGYTEDVLGPHGVLDSRTAFLQKPFTPSVFLAKVQQVLDATAPGKKQLS